MGGCATKPKVLKGEQEEVQAPVPPPEPTKEPVPSVPEAKDAAHVAAESESKVEAANVVVDEPAKAKDINDEAAKAVVNDGTTIDDQANKSRSLSNLFKEKGTNGATESHETISEPAKSESLVETVKLEAVEPVKTAPVEPVKQKLPEAEKRAPSDAEKLKELNSTMNQVIEELAKPVEQTNDPMPKSVAPQMNEVKTESAEAAVNMPETHKKETSVDGNQGKTEVAK